MDSLNSDFKNNKFELLNSAFNAFQFDKNINKVNISLPLDNTKHYYTCQCFCVVKKVQST